MPGERIQRRIDRLLDEAEAAADRKAWSEAAELAREVLALDEANEDARALIAAASRLLAEDSRPVPPASERAPLSGAPASPSSAQPSSFANGRYSVAKFLGEGGKKKVFLAHDGLLDRDVAFALIKTEGLDAIGRERVIREAQTMGRLGAHPHIVSIFDLGELEGQPFVVTELMGGGDVEGLLEKAGGPLSLERTLEVGKAVARGLVFAHSKGVVHRDLKPGNVWLTAEGVAKIGDFGLAVALDRTRLTVHGMMVGTVSYMPPEQALGGEITPRADLYSLGAMLYEMVTGKPPFSGGDATAVISQHINTPPVAPSWQTDRCPAALEELILRLLAKAPGERPESAAQVLRVLEGVDPKAAGVRHSETGANPLERLARGVFVGREQELERLRKAFDEAFAGRGGLVMLVGEPGIGKTRTVQELETYARMRGAQVLWGRAHESSGAPPYWPWVQVGNAYSANNDLETLTTPGDDSMSELVWLFPRLRQLMPSLPEPSGPRDPDTAQFRLFEAYAAFIRQASARAPLLLALDDLHWADRSSLLLLQHLARELARLRVLVIGTYRDTELSRTHPLSEALAALNRDASLFRLPLRGLAREEVSAYVRTATGLTPAPEVEARIFEETEGNPFFLSEMVNLLTQEGTLGKQSLSEVAIPDGVREALGRRLDRVSAETNALLQVCAVVGREFAYDTLNLLSDHDDEDLLRRIEEALEARVIEEMEQPGRYRFTHALMQETLLSELSTTRRVRLQGQVGDALERRWGPRAEEHAARLAQHFSEAATLSAGHREKAARYLNLAGKAAMASAATDEAARWFGECLELVTESDDGLGLDRAALLFDLGMSEGTSDIFKVGAFFQHIDEAFSLFAARGAGESAGKAALGRLRGTRSIVPATERADIARRGLAVVPGHAREIRASLLAQLALANFDDEGAAAAAEARAVAEELDLPGVIGTLELREVELAYRDHRLRDARAHGWSAYEACLAAGETASAVDALQTWSLVPMLRGEVDEACEALQRAAQFAQSVGTLSIWRICATRAEATARLRAPGLPLPEFAMGDFQVEAALVRGDLEAAARFFLGVQEKDLGRSGWEWLLGQRASIHAAAGRREAALADLRLWEALHSPIDRPIANLVSLQRVSGALIALGSRELVANAYRELLPWDEARAWDASYDAIRGFLALRLDLVDEAEAHFQAGVAWAERERCPVELGRCQQGLAEVAERRGDHSGALALLERAGALFSEHGACLYLDQVLAKKEILKA